MDIQLKNGELIKWVGISDTVADAIKSQPIGSEEFTASRNTFIKQLINRIGATRVESANLAENPFKEFDSFPINFGDTIQNIFVPTYMGYDYDIAKAGVDLLKPVTPTVFVDYVVINYQKQYKVTIYDNQLRQAFINEYGVAQLVDFIVQSMYVSADLDEYYANIYQLSASAEMYKDGFQTLTTTEATKGKDITAKIIDIVSDMKYPDSIYNKNGVINPTSLENCVLVITEKNYNTINLDYLTGVFNLSKVDLLKNIKRVKSFKVPVWVNASGQDATKGSLETRGEELDFVIIDKRGFSNHLALSTTGYFYNPEGMFSNHYHNRWRLYGFKRSFNAVAYKLSITE